MLKPELIDGLMSLVDAHRGTVFTEANTNSLFEALALAKAAIPSGQAATDLLMVRVAIGMNDAAHDALSRIAAQAQSVRHAWERQAEKDKAYGDMIAQRDAALEEVEVLRTCVAGHNERSKILLDAKNHWADRARSAEARSAQLAAAGQALSAHVDKTAGGGGSPDNPCPRLSDMPVGVERPCHEHDATWTMRDDFAMVATHTIVTVCKAEIDDGRLNFRDVARRAYGMADEMLKARDAK